ncbi:MAG TPA: hypothetical protein VGL22_14755 [Terracidiphilus sp.]
MLRRDPNHIGAMHFYIHAVEASTPAEGIFMPVENHSRRVNYKANAVLCARIAAAKGDTQRAIELLRDAVANQDQLLYDEPADWYYPVRESLGGLLLRNGDPVYR